MQLLVGIIIGFIVSEIISGRTPGRNRFYKSLKFNFKNYSFHIHHWMWSIVLLLIINYNGYVNFLIDGVLLGICIQGLTYKDYSEYFKIIKK